MLKNDPNYQRLKLGGAGLLGSSTLWLARDHLLVVEVTGYMERYRRFYFRDIQAVIVQKTGLRMWWSIGLGTLLGFALLILALSSWDSTLMDPVRLGLLAIFLLCLGVPLLVNVFRGPTCAIFLRTAVQTQKIPNLTRRKKVEQLVAVLTQAAAAAQESPAAPADAGTTTDLPGALPG